MRNQLELKSIGLLVVTIATHPNQTVWHHWTMFGLLYSTVYVTFCSTQLWQMLCMREGSLYLT